MFGIFQKLTFGCTRGSQQKDMDIASNLMLVIDILGDANKLMAKAILQLS
jgi:hypothetical protein